MPVWMYQYPSRWQEILWMADLEKNICHGCALWFRWNLHNSCWHFIAILMEVRSGTIKRWLGHDSPHEWISVIIESGLLLCGVWSVCFMLIVSLALRLFSMEALAMCQHRALRLPGLHKHESNKYLFFINYQVSGTVVFPILRRVHFNILNEFLILQMV